MASIKSQGSQLYVVDSLTSSVAAVVAITCPTGISGLGGAADQIDDTCLDATVDRSFVRGLGNPGQVSVPFVLKSPTAASHELLFLLKDSGDTVGWMICLSDGTDAPTLDVNDALVAPVGRTSFAFQAYVSDVTIDVATNEVVRGTLTLQRSGSVTPYWV